MKNIGLKHILILSAILHFIAAIFSSGFQHFDEHFQIIEFLNYKDGGISGSELPWEFREQIRPWFQPFIYFHIYKFFSLFGVESPFLHVFFLRLITTFFGLFSLYSFYPVLRKWFETINLALLAYGLMSLCWFVPYIFTRTSSESFGVSFFLLGTSLFLRLEDFKKVAWMAILSGLFLGLSYQSRFQMAAMVAPLWFWALFFKKRTFSELALVALGVLFGIGSGLVFDYWGYGEWSFSLWHYFRTNFLEGIMSSVQQYPFWWYVRLAFNRGIPPVSLVLILATFWGWFKFRKHPLTWMTVPLFLFHSFVGHKELRYLFPIIILSPLYLAFFIQCHEAKVLRLWKSKMIRAVTYLTVGVNFILLVVVCFRAANPAVSFYKFVYKNPKIEKIHAHEENPFSMLGLPIRFYLRENLEIEVFKNLNEIGALKGKYLFFRKGKNVFEMEQNYPGCNLEYLAYPKFSLKFNIGNWLSRSRVWSLYYCR